MNHFSKLFLPAIALSLIALVAGCDQNDGNNSRNKQKTENKDYSDPYHYRDCE